MLWMAAEGKVTRAFPIFPPPQQYVDGGDERELNEARNQFNAAMWPLDEADAVQRLTIGPAFKPDVTREEGMVAVKKWVREWKFNFLPPLPAPQVDPKAALDRLVPAKKIEQDVVDCQEFKLPL